MFDESTSNSIYEFLKNNVEWQDGIYSRRYKKITRSAYMEGNDVDIDDYLQSLVDFALLKINSENKKYISFGMYVNYYKNGNDFLPSHSHPNTIQLVLSFGTTRKLKVNSKYYDMTNGDCIMFGSGFHSIDTDPDVVDGRISIATFLTPLN